MGSVHDLFYIIRLGTFLLIFIKFPMPFLNVPIRNLKMNQGRLCNLPTPQPSNSEKTFSLSRVCYFCVLVKAVDSSHQMELYLTLYFIANLS